jgi:hypothetical protein
MKPDPKRIQLARVFVGVAVVGAAGFVAFFEVSEHARAPADFQAAFIVAAVWSVLLAARVARRSIVEAKRGAPLHALHIASAAVASAGVPLVVRAAVPSPTVLSVGVVAAFAIVLAGALFRLGNAAQAKAQTAR